MRISRRLTKPPLTTAPAAENGAVVVGPAPREKPLNAPSSTADPQQSDARLGREVSKRPVTRAPSSSQTLLAARTTALTAETTRSAQRYAAIDMGSSSAKLLVVEIGTDGHQKTLLDRKISTRLGADVPNVEFLECA
jgi:hypothetical protein